MAFEMTKPVFTREEKIRRMFRRVAQVLFEVWEEGWRHTRLLDEPLIPTHLVEAGRSKKGAEHREHVIPLLVIYNHCERMFAEEVPIQAVADFLERNVKIVWISKEEQRRIDFDLGLKSKMPEGWSFSDGDTYARLHLGGVEWDGISSTPINQESQNA